MAQIGETMVLRLQGTSTSLDRESRERTLLEFLTDTMDAAPARRVVVVQRRSRSLKERLRLNAIACCGAHWGFGPINVLDDDHQESPQQAEPLIPTPPPPPETSVSTSCTGMNLATALAAERQYRSAQESPVGPSRPTSGPIETPLRMSLMRLLHETEYEDLERECRENDKAGGCDAVCCVCMGRKKGAAFIPCGHTFCRVCSRELWLNRGACPLCNRPILEILDIF